MKKSLILALTLFGGNAAWAFTDHYLLREDTHVLHLKITKVGDDVYATMDVNFEPNSSEAGRAACSADIAGDAKFVAPNRVVLKKQIEGEARYCTLTIDLTATGAKVEQSPDCGHYAAGLCHFSSGGKELAKIK